MTRYGATCWLLNTGWVGGAYGVGQRISIRHTRDLLNAALTGQLAGVEYYTDSVFGFEVPKCCPGVPDDVLYPATSWPSEAEYFEKYRQLAGRYVDNFKKYARRPPEVAAAAEGVDQRLRRLKACRISTVAVVVAHGSKPSARRNQLSGSLSPQLGTLQVVYPFLSRKGHQSDSGQPTVQHLDTSVEA
jgi:hypothetical protein